MQMDKIKIWIIFEGQDLMDPVIKRAEINRQKIGTSISHLLSAMTGGYGISAGKKWADLYGAHRWPAGYDKVTRPMCTSHNLTSEKNEKHLE